MEAGKTTYGNGTGSIAQVEAEFEIASPRAQVEIEIAAPRSRVWRAFIDEATFWWPR
jgi:hypothetical protein